MSETLSREIALRIGLAARALPDVEPARLLGVLLEIIEEPITEEKLVKLKVKDLKTASDGELGEISPDNLKEALNLLQTDLEGNNSSKKKEELPEIEVFDSESMLNSIRIAVASNTAELLDGHFGSCTRFLIYQISSELIKLIDIRNANPAEPPEDKNVFRTELIKDCHILYVGSIGGPAAAKVVKANIHPIKHPDKAEARVVLEGLKQRISDNPPPWLAKVMGIAQTEQTTFEDSEDVNS